MTLTHQVPPAAALVLPLLLLVSPVNGAFVHVPTSTAVRPSSCSEQCLLFMTKNPDRARVEKNLEDMMGDDWRVFRARLVAQERAEAEEAARQKGSSTNAATAAAAATNGVGGAAAVGVKTNGMDDKQARQAQLGEIFAGAISSIFKSKEEQQQQQSMKKNGNNRNGNEGSSIFDGDAVGGATVYSTLPGDCICEDPFVSEDEIPIMMKPKVAINKHRWAHPISHIEPGCLLVANEKLGGVFHQTVVLVIDHHEATGSTGVVINRPLEGNLLKIASETDSNVDLSLKLAFNSARVSYGGPVMQEEYSILHGYGEVEGSKKVAPGVFVGGSEELINQVRQNKFSPENALFVKGHAAWVPGQLSREISKGVWYTAAASSDMILRYAGAPITEEDNKDDLWSDVLMCMGGEYAEVAKRHAGRGDMRMMP